MQPRTGVSHGATVRRWSSIVLRSLHLAGVVLAAIAILGHGPHPGAAFALMLFTGVALFLIDLLRHPSMWREVAGAFIALKLVVVAVMMLVPQAAVPLFWALLLASSVVSHAPHAFRHARILR